MGWNVITAYAVGLRLVIRSAQRKKHESHMIYIYMQNLSKIKWLLLSLFYFSSSLAKYEKDWLKETPSLVFPLEQIRDLGRPITLFFLLLIILLVLFTKNKRRYWLVPKPLYFLAIVQLIIFFKTLYAGDIIFAFQALFGSPQHEKAMETAKIAVFRPFGGL